MSVILTNLSNNLYTNSREQLNISAQKHGIERINSYAYEDLLHTDFYKQHKHILDRPKGIGYWLWKPYIILESMKLMADDDVVIYSDCGIEIINNLDPLIEICINKSPIVLFGNCNYTNALWTKRDCFVFMDCDHPYYWYGPHCDAAFSLWRKNDTSVKFLNEWLSYGGDERIITDNPNVCGKENLPEFNDHRWDQSILSLLAQKNKIDLYRMPTQFGNHYKMNNLRIEGEINNISQSIQEQVIFYSVIPYYNSAYLQLLNHHRSKNSNQSGNSNIIIEEKPTLKQALKKIAKKYFNRSYH